MAVIRNRRAGMDDGVRADGGEDGKGRVRVLECIPGCPGSEPARWPARDFHRADPSSGPPSRAHS